MAERKVFKDYDESNVNDVFEQAHASSWLDLVNYLEQRGLDAWRISPGGDAHMIADAKQAMKDNVPFSRNPEQCYRVLKSHRNPELVRQEEQKWVSDTEKKPSSTVAQRRREA